MFSVFVSFGFLCYQTIFLVFFCQFCETSEYRYVIMAKTCGGASSQFYVYYLYMCVLSAIKKKKIFTILGSVVSGGGLIVHQHISLPSVHLLRPLLVGY